MKTEVEKLGGLNRRIKVEVPADVVQAALEKMYKSVQSQAKFKGFRPGKAPLTMIKTHYKSEVEKDVVSHIVEVNTNKALVENELRPASDPQIEFGKFQEGEAFSFTATFEVYPEVTIKKFKGLNVEKEKLEIAPEMVDSILENLRQSKSMLKPMLELRPAQMGDVAIIDFKGFVDGQPLAGGSAEERPLELGSNSFITGFEEGIVGMQPGSDKTINLKFPTPYNPTELSGKDVRFEVTLKEIKRKALPELDDEFAKTIGQHTSMAHLREEILKDVSEGEEKRVRDELKNRLLQALVEANPMEVPRVLVAEQKEILIKDVHGRLEQQGMKHDEFEEYKKKWDKDFEKSAEFVVRSSLLINAIAREEKLFATDADVEQKMNDFVKQSGIELEKVKAFYGQQDRRQRLLFQITEDKVMKCLTENANIKEVTKDKIKKEED